MPLGDILGQSTSFLIWCWASAHELILELQNGLGWHSQSKHIISPLVLGNLFMKHILELLNNQIGELWEDLLRADSETDRFSSFQSSASPYASLQKHATKWQRE